MGLLLIAQEQASKGWWFEWVDAWGNTASVVGFLVTIVAFPVTWKIQRQIRLTNQKTLRRVALVNLSTSIEDLHRQLATGREAGRLGLWLRAFDCCHNARFGVLRLVGNPHLTHGEELALRTHANDLMEVIQYIEANKLGENPPAAFQHEKKVIIDATLLLLTQIQGRLGTQTWEV